MSVTPYVTTKANNSNYDVSADQWNSVCNTGLEKGLAYIVRKNGATYEAINGSTGKIVDTDIIELIKNIARQLNGVGFKRA
jgi:hypothetical protein